MRKVIVTVSLTGGVQTKKDNPNLPEQPKRSRPTHMRVTTKAHQLPISMPAIKTESRQATSKYSRRYMRRFVRSATWFFRTAREEAPASHSSKGSMSDAKPEMASLNMVPSATIGSAAEHVANPRPSWRDLPLRCKENIKPEMEIYHHGMIREMRNFIDKGLIQKPYYVNCVMGMAYQGAVEATPENLVTLVNLLPEGTIFNCCAIGRAQIPLRPWRSFSADRRESAWKITFTIQRECSRRTTLRWSRRVSASSRISVMRLPHRRRPERS